MSSPGIPENLRKDNTVKVTISADDVGIGGGTQYTEGATDTTITGSVAMWEDAADTVVATSATKPLPVEIVAGAGSGGTAAADDADFTAGTTSGTPAMGVYESTPTSVTDGDLGTIGITQGRRVKTSATVDASLPAGTNAIGKLAANSGVDIGDVDVTSSALPTGASTSAKQDTIIGHLDGVEGILTTMDADTGALAGTVSGAELQVDIVSAPTLTVNSHAVTNAGTFPVQVDGAALTSLQLLDDTVFAEDVAASAADKGVAILAVRRDADTSLVGADNDYANLQVNANGALKVEAFSGETLPVSLSSTTVTGTVAVTQSGTWDEVGINDSGNSITVDNGGTFATQSTLQAGTAAVGKLLAPDIDVTTHTNYAKKYYTNAGAVTDGIVWSPAAGKRWHVVTMYIQVSAAATVTLEDDKAGGDEAVWKAELAANSGVAIPWGEKYPLASGEDAADLLITTSAGNVYVTVTGYEI